MFERLLTIKYITSKNCFCYLSANNTRDLDGNTLQMSYGNGKIAYVSVDLPNVSVDDKTVGISSLYAKALGINDEEEVVLTEIVKPPTIKSLTISPKTSTDYEVIEMLADTIQSTLLDQIRVLHNGQDIVIWIGNAIHVLVHAYDIHPISPGRIDNFTEVVIKPPERHSPTNSVRRKSIPNAKTSKFSKYLENKENLVLRLVPIDNININSQFVHPFNVFVSNKNLFAIDTIKNPQIYRGRLLELSDEIKCVYVRLFAIEDIVKDFQAEFLSDDNVFVSDAIFDLFNCKIGTRILLEPWIEPCPNVEEIEICCKRNFSLNIEEIFKNYLGEIHQPFLLSSKVVFEIGPTLRCKLNFLPGHSDFCVIDSDFVRNCKFSVVSETLPDATRKKGDGHPCCTNVANYEEIVTQAVFVLVQNKLRIDSKWDNVLITGSSGSGKSTLLEIIEHELESFPYYVYIRKIDCKSIKGKTIDSLHKMFNGVMFDLVHHQPAVLVIDDLHILCEHVNESDALAQNALYFNRISEMLEGVFQNFAEHNLFGILATAESTTKLNKNIYATRGNHLFKHVHVINNLEKKDRRILLDYFFSKHDVDNVDFDKLTEKTESFVIRDLADFANKSSFESYQEDYESKIPKLTNEHCDRALENTVITSLDGINLHPPGTKDFNDIGGLDEVKTILVEMMMWPSKYPSLFSNSPLRLPSGLLLYGPPGTGKTILAGAAARHCGLRLISIKGPELLSKYIGASEQAVRDVFQRAQNAKPCVLFFDEFDSLAPRRGHDNTGVTDRVVNQLLTQLDGVETLTGVFVLAATSRPDLLDPALLRPGRLDRHIRCCVPDRASRLDILRVLSRTMNLAENVDLSKIAGESEGFSGADLQSVLYSAQLASVEDLLSDDKTSSDVESVITQDKLEEALSKTRPSLSKQEKTKYDNIYQKFEGGGVDNFKTGSRATLA